MKLRRRDSDSRLIGSVSELRDDDHISYTDPESGKRITGLVIYVRHISEWGNDEVIMTIRATSGKGMLVDMTTGEPIVWADKILTDTDLNNGTIIYRRVK